MQDKPRRKILLSQVHWIEQFLLRDHKESFHHISLQPNPCPIVSKQISVCRSSSTRFLWLDIIVLFYTRLGRNTQPSILHPEAFAVYTFCRVQKPFAAHVL